MTGFLLACALGLLLTPVLALLSYRLGVWPWARKTYLFWSALSLVNPSLLLFLAVPPLLLLEPSWLGKFGAFLWLPLLAASIITLSAIASVRLSARHLRNSRHWSAWAPYIWNLLFLLTFLLAAEMRKDWAVAKALAGRKAECLWVQSFAESVVASVRIHARFEEDGRVYYWSYARMGFYEPHTALDRNFPCPGGRSSYP